MSLNPNDLASYQRFGDRLGKVGQSSEEAGEHAHFLGLDADGRFKQQSFEATLDNLAAISTDIGRNITGQVIAAILEIQTLVVAGGNSTRVGIGPVGTPVKYGVTADLLKNSKITTNVDLSSIAPVSAEDVQVNMIQADGTTIGTTAATAGKVRLTLFYNEAGAYANTA